MNEHLVERFGRGKAVRDSRMPRTSTTTATMTLNLSIREYARTADQPADPSHWTGFREIPSSSEVFDAGRIQHGETLELTGNTVVGPYASTEEYLESHYKLLREDAVAPLRDVVSEVQVYPHLMEKESDNGAFIYEKVSSLDNTSYNVGSLWLGIHHWLDVRQCRDCSPRHLLIKTDREKSQLGAVKTFTYRASSCTDSGK